MNKSTCLGTAKTPTEQAVEATWSGIPSAFRQSQARPRLNSGRRARPRSRLQASREQSCPGKRSPLVALLLVLPVCKVNTLARCGIKISD